MVLLAGLLASDWIIIMNITQQFKWQTADLINITHLRIHIQSHWIMYAEVAANFVLLESIRKFKVAKETFLAQFPISAFPSHQFQLSTWISLKRQIATRSQGHSFASGRFAVITSLLIFSEMSWKWTLLKPTETLDTILLWDPRTWTYPCCVMEMMTASTPLPLQTRTTGRCCCWCSVSPWYSGTFW